MRHGPVKTWVTLLESQPHGLRGHGREGAVVRVGANMTALATLTAEEAEQLRDQLNAALQQIEDRKTATGSQS